MVPPFCTFSLHLAALRDLAFLSAASVFKHQLKYDGGHFYTIYSPRWAGADEGDV